MKTKYEIIQIDNTEITVDVSMLTKSNELFFNATDMAKSFGKRPNDFWKQPQNKEYLDALITLSEGNYTTDYYVRTIRGKYGGTYLHRDLALQFARWLSPIFAVKLDRWIMERLRLEAEWQRQRLEARTGFLPMTKAIYHAHKKPQHYHFSNEADMLNWIVLGMRAKEYRKVHNVDDVRSTLSAAELEQVDHLQRVNTGLIEVGMDYAQRKELLIEVHNRQLQLYETIAA